jgi:hypothetical protein
MTTSRLLQLAWQFTWTQKRMWLWGFLATAGAHLFALLLPPLGQTIEAFRAGITPPDPDEFMAFMDRLNDPAILIAGSVAIFSITTAAWLLNLISESRLIVGAHHFTPTVTSHSDDLPRDEYDIFITLVALDTLLFLPLFLLVMLILLVLLGIVLSILILAISGGEIQNLVAVGGIGLLCLIPVFLLISPVQLLMRVFRTLTFRHAILQGRNARQSLREVWQLFRQQTGPLLLLILLLIGGNFIVQALLGALFGSLSLAVQTISTGLLGNLAVRSIQLAQIVVGSGLFVLVSAAWTIGYEKMLVWPAVREL